MVCLKPQLSSIPHLSLVGVDIFKTCGHFKTFAKKLLFLIPLHIFVIMHCKLRKEISNATCMLTREVAFFTCFFNVWTHDNTELVTP